MEGGFINGYWGLTHLRCLVVVVVVGPRSDRLGWRSLGFAAVGRRRRSGCGRLQSSISLSQGAWVGTFCGCLGELINIDNDDKSAGSLIGTDFDSKSD